MEGLQRINILYGANGSGKTSLLEAIHILGMARSFRGSSIKSLITHDQDTCTVYGRAVVPSTGHSQAMGVQRLRNGATQIRIAGKTVSAVAELTAYLPLQVINSASFDLLTGSPATRRRFINWGVFHVEQQFFPEWQRFQRCIKQRNVLLRRDKIPERDLSVWTRDLAQSGAAINKYHLAYIEKLVPKFLSIMGSLTPSLAADLELRYRQGWDKSLDYPAALERGLKADLDLGYTHVGPQRADIKVMIGGHSAAETLSRGQQKLVVTGLKLAQGMVLSEQGGTNCTYLLDDLPAELDGVHSQRVCNILSGMGAQVFITCVDRDDIVPHWPEGDELGMFHVEHGEISPQE